MPVTWLARMLEYHFFGVNAAEHHSVNVLFHLANTVLVFSIFNRMTGAPWRSAGVAALFALHPLHVEPVAWVTGFKDVLCMFFGLLTIWAYVRYVEEFTAHSSPPPSPLAHRLSPSALYALTLALFALAVMAKPMMVTLPLVLLLLDYWPLGRTRWAEPALARSQGGTGDGVKTAAGRLLKEKLPFFVLAVAASVMTVLARRSFADIASLEKLPLGQRVANAVVAYVNYLRQTIWPGGLAVYYPYRDWPWLVVVECGLVLVLLSAWVMRRRHRHPQFVVGWLWFLGTLVPAIGLVQVGSLFTADRYTYLPLTGLFIMVAWGVPDRAVRSGISKIIVCSAAGVILALCGLLSRVQVGYWKNSETLFRHALSVTRDNWLAYGNLGSALLSLGRTSEAVVQFEQAVQIKPDFSQAHNNLAVALGRLGRVTEAIQQAEQAVAYKPDFAEAHYNLAIGLEQVGREREALACFEKAVHLKPDYATAHYAFGLALEQTGRVREAIDHYEQAVYVKPDYVSAQNNLAWLLATLAPADGGDPARAVALAQRACTLTGNRLPPYLDTLAAGYAAAGRFSEAVDTGQKAVALARSAGQSKLADEIQRHLEVYRKGRAWRR